MSIKCSPINAPSLQILKPNRITDKNWILNQRLCAIALVEILTPPPLKQFMIGKLPIYPLLLWYTRMWSFISKTKASYRPFYILFIPPSSSCLNPCTLYLFVRFYLLFSHYPYVYYGHFNYVWGQYFWDTFISSRLPINISQMFHLIP